MNIALAKSPVERTQGDLFAAASGRLPGQGVVADVRKAAFDEFAALGLPHRRIEEWKYTDLRALLREVAPLAPSPDQAALDLAAKAIAALELNDTIKLVLVDGAFIPALSDHGAAEAGLTIRVLKDILDNADVKSRADLLRTTVASDATILLNTALATDGVIVDVADGVVLSKPVHIVHVATGSNVSAVTRSLIKIGQNARVSLVENFVAADGAAAYQAHDSVVVSIGDGAQLQHVRLVEDSPDAANLTTGIFSLGANAMLNFFNLTNGAEVSRYQGFVTFTGEGGSLSTNGVDLLRATEHGDTTLVIDHAVPNCSSREEFRAVLDERAHAVFQGRIIVRPDAQHTDGKMMSRSLLLSDDAAVDNKPELEIFADDVVCGHGATTGALDDSLLFYLRARGLPEKEAQALLIQAFVGEIVESIVDDTLREWVVSAVERWLAARTA